MSVLLIVIDVDFESLLEITHLASSGESSLELRIDQRSNGDSFADLFHPLHLIQFSARRCLLVFDFLFFSTFKCRSDQRSFTPKTIATLSILKPLFHSRSPSSQRHSIESDSPLTPKLKLHNSLSQIVRFSFLNSFCIEIQSRFDYVLRRETCIDVKRSSRRKRLKRRDTRDIR